MEYVRYKNFVKMDENLRNMSPMDDCCLPQDVKWMEKAGYHRPWTMMDVLRHRHVHHQNVHLRQAVVQKAGQY